LPDDVDVPAISRHFRISFIAGARFIGDCAGVRSAKDITGKDVKGRLMGKTIALVSADDIRTLFSTAISAMYREEVPQYGALIGLVAAINAKAMTEDPALNARLAYSGEIFKLELERHGAVRLGTPQELNTIRRLFAVMGMSAVGYYDLSVAGVPVHSTAFRPIDDVSLRRNPFRVFTSLLRVDLIANKELRREVVDILSRRSIYTPQCLALIERAESNGGLAPDEAEKFVSEALETFRWHGQATVSSGEYKRLRAAHPLIADIVCFKGPHINHLTPRTLDIDATQAGMAALGLQANAVVEGPPSRKTPILLRQSSFKALQETIDFVSVGGLVEAGAHTARFGEVEQRGAALTRKGRALYDKLLSQTQEDVKVDSEGGNSSAYVAALTRHFKAFPDDEGELRRAGLAYFRYSPTRVAGETTNLDMESLIAFGWVKAEPIVYEDFLPVSAAGIFRSNLGEEQRESFGDCANQAAFEKALGTNVIAPDSLYEMQERVSIEATALALVPSQGALLTRK
jgi:uncharacterized glyoxalase superfamily metalloenzyme YdcJ